LWSVPRDGGEAARLTSGTGTETDPAFSPDGKLVAFTGEYDGNVDVFVVPASGGVPKRLTWHPAPDRVLGWTPDGKRIIFSSPRTSYSRFNEMFTVPVEGGVEEKLPFPSGYEASMSPDGQSIAYEPIGKAFTMWKKYRGGQTTRIWLARLSDSSVTKVPRANSNDFNPNVGGGARLLPFGSQWPGHAVLLRYEDESGARSGSEHRPGPEIRLAGAGCDRVRTVRRHFHLRPQDGQIEIRSDSSAGRFSRASREIRKRRANTGEPGSFAQRRSRGFCRAR